MLERYPDNGRVVSIFIARDKGLPMEFVTSAMALVGRGLEGDRYEKRIGAYSKTKRIPDEDRQVSLISLNGIREANKIMVDKRIAPFSPAETRRNLVLTIDPERLNSLVGRTFRLGGLEMEGVELCDPCRRPAQVLGRSTNDGKIFEEAFQGLGGLRARILKSGLIGIGSTLIS